MALQLIKITKFYQFGKNKQTVLNNLTIKFPSKGLIAIVGKSGSGKSTLLNIIAGIEKANSGQILIDGHELERENIVQYQKDYISYVYQFYNLIPSLTIKQNIILPALIKGYSYNDIEFKMMTYCNQLEIVHLLNNYPDQLSGGQKQRVGLVRAFLCQTPILLADEPTGALNGIQSKEVMKLLKQYAKQHLVIVISHNISLIKKYTSQIIDLDQNINYYDFKTSKYHKYSTYFLPRQSKRLFFYIKQQIKYQRNKLIMMFVSQIFIIIAFVLLLSACNGGWLYLKNRFQSDPLKEIIEVYQNDYLNTMFKEDDITKFKENSLIDDVSFKLDFSQGVFKGNQNFEIYQIKNTKNFDYQSGHYPSKENQIVINQKAAKKYDLKVNDEIEYELNGISYSFSISAIISDYVNEGNNIYIDRNIIDENLRQQLETKDVLILVCSKYKQVLDKYQDDFLLVSYHQEYVDSYQMLFDLAYIVVIIFISVSFFISIILISIILKTIFIERKKDTCILQVNGISKLRIVSLFGFEAMLIGMIIGIVGSVVAFGTLFLISLFDLDKNIIGINNLFVLPRYFLGSFDLFILLIFIYIIICWISGVHGALIINKMDGSILLKEN